MANLTLTFEQLENTIAARYAAEARIRELEAKLAGVEIATKRSSKPKETKVLTEEELAEKEAKKKANILAGQAKRKETLAAKKAAEKEAEHRAWLEANKDKLSESSGTSSVGSDEDL